ncbi:MAG: hypothetical protein DWQ47_08500 [Acidobacteria bacterium]|nr:MAG: hypothetical protein DWQ32_16600 [Acidobacteriota bacterium]REJ99051.1 MAG: hypothetical protein DWQ38_13380 [Acidobacteriota bacterium]REK16228.1 MAG: hypothetical protein DWQ43_04310 [Acidobacteriota bacterium]REK43909.1 MAG: hypothetical protein DWQ47_08500 [Acidobacteriota bacterium]
MVLTLLSFAFVIITAIFTFKTARDNGYNAVGWTALSVVLFFSLPIFAGVAFVVVLYILLGESGADEFLEYYMFLTSIVMMLPAVVSSLLILRHVNTLKDDDLPIEPPTPGELGL